MFSKLPLVSVSCLLNIHYGGPKLLVTVFGTVPIINIIVLILTAFLALSSGEQSAGGG
jgi:hypothetical protein